MLISRIFFLSLSRLITVNSATLSIKELFFSQKKISTHCIIKNENKNLNFFYKGYLHIKGLDYVRSIDQ